MRNVAAARCGSDEGDVAALLMTRTKMAATRVFDFVQMSGYTQTERELSVLLNHFSSPFAALGGTASAVLSEWHRLNRMVLRDDVLRELPLEELYFRAFVHFQYNHFNVLLLAALVQAAAMDVVLAESAMSRLLPCLKSESKHNKGKMLLFMVGHAWQRINAHDVCAITAESLVHKWMVASVGELAPIPARPMHVCHIGPYVGCGCFGCLGLCSGRPIWVAMPAPSRAALQQPHACRPSVHCGPTKRL